MNQKQFKAMHRAARLAWHNMPLAADGAPQWTAVESFYDSVPRWLQTAIGQGDSDILATRRAGSVGNKWSCPYYGRFSVNYRKGLHYD